MFLPIPSAPFLILQVSLVLKSYFLNGASSIGKTFPASVFFFFHSVLHSPYHNPCFFNICSAFVFWPLPLYSELSAAWMTVPFWSSLYSLSLHGRVSAYSQGSVNLSEGWLSKSNWSADESSGPLPALIGALPLMLSRKLQKFILRENTEVQ